MKVWVMKEAPDGAEIVIVPGPKAMMAPITIRGVSREAVVAETRDVLRAIRPGRVPE